MAGVNKVILVGFLGADPEARTTPAGQMVANMSVATSEVFNNREGQRQERTEWHQVVLWGKLAELAHKWLQKGSQVYLEGKLQTRSWDDQQSGQKRYKTEVVADRMTFLGSPKGQQRTDEQHRQQQQAPAADPGPGYFDEDVPF